MELMSQPQIEKRKSRSSGSTCASVYSTQYSLSMQIRFKLKWNCAGYEDKKNIIVVIWDVGTRYIITVANEDLFCGAFFFYCRKYTRTSVC